MKDYRSGTPQILSSGLRWLQFIVKTRNYCIPSEMVETDTTHPSPSPSAPATYARSCFQKICIIEYSQNQFYECHGVEINRKLIPFMNLLGIWGPQINLLTKPEAHPRLVSSWSCTLALAIFASSITIAQLDMPLWWDRMDGSSNLGCLRGWWFSKVVQTCAWHLDRTAAGTCTTRGHEGTGGGGKKLAFFCPFFLLHQLLHILTSAIPYTHLRLHAFTTQVHSGHVRKTPLPAPCHQK